jgi:hypothetical protein
MMRALKVSALLAMGLLVASSFAAAQDKPAGASGGQVMINTAGVSDVSSSKFTEYREVPKGLSIPFMNLFSTSSTLDFNLRAYNVRQGDQRYAGWANTGWLGVSFDYNQIPHNMGNNGRIIFAETAPGVWSMSSTLRKALGDAADATSTTGRTYPFYASLLAPTFAATNSIDISSMRQRGSVEVDLGKKLPFDLRVTYMRELKTGSRTAGGGNILGAISPVVEVPEPLDEVVQDFGVRTAYKFTAGNVHASVNRNTYNNQAETLTVDNPFRASDLAYVSASVPGGPASARFVNAPDNEATTGAFGVLLKFKRNTRVAGDVGMASWTQNAAFYPYTINSTIKTGTGAPADLVSSLQQPSLNGKINTSTLNFSFSSKPIEGLGIRMRYRSYDLSNKTARWVITGDTSAAPDRSWGAATPAADAPYGHATANPYDSATKRFDGSVSYDIKGLTIEGALHRANLTRSSREATSGEDTGYLVSAVSHTSDWLDVRLYVGQDNRTANGTTLYGFQMDEAERKTTRTGVNLELTPMPSLGVTFAYLHRNVEYPNRPDRIAVSQGVPVAGAVPIPGTPSGLLWAKYDSYTGEIEFTPNERVEIGAYYTYEKDANTNQWSTTTGVSLNNLLTYATTNNTNTFGANATFQLVPEKWKFSLMARRQNVDDLMDITSREGGSFYTPGRTTIIASGQGGAQDITDFDDTTLTTTTAQLDYAVAKSWEFSMGYAYEKYDFADAYTSGTSLMPQAVLIFLKADNGAYNASVVYAKLNYRW